MRLSDLSSRVYNFVGPALVSLSDYAWFAGSTALLLTLPMLVEIQRETTVLVMQRQREQELAQVQEQARHANVGVVEQMKGLGSLLSSAASSSSSQ